MKDDTVYPEVPTRIVDPIVYPETTAPTPAVEPACPECTIAGNEALSKMTEIRKKSQKATGHTPAPAPAPENEERGTKNA